MNPSSKRGFHVLLVLFKVLPSLLLRILGLGRYPNKTLGFWEQTNNYAIVWKTIPSFKSPCSSIPLILACYSLFSSSSSLLLLLLLLFSPSLLSLSTVLSLKMRLLFGLISCLLRPCLAKTRKPIFLNTFLIFTLKFL